MYAKLSIGICIITEDTNSMISLEESSYTICLRRLVWQLLVESCTFKRTFYLKKKIRSFCHKAEMAIG